MSETMKWMFLSENNWEMTNNNKTQKKRNEGWIMRSNAFVALAFSYKTKIILLPSGRYRIYEWNSIVKRRAIKKIFN